MNHQQPDNNQEILDIDPALNYTTIKTNDASGDEDAY